MNIKIRTSGSEDALPYCSPLVYEQLQKAFHLDYLMSYNLKNNDEKIGYIQGVLDVLGYVKMLAKITDKE